MQLPAPIRRLAEAAAGTFGLREQLTVEQNNVQLLRESVLDLERQLFDPGWVRLTALSQIEFSAEGLIQLRAICRLYAIKNPLIKRALALRTAYVWGQGVEITARANGRRAKPGEQDVQAVVAAFLRDEGNARAVTGPAARERLERTLGTDGEVYLVHFTRPLTGQVQARTILADEIAEVIPNPDDRSEPWYYRRRWTRSGYDAQGNLVRSVEERLYPDIDYRPLVRPKRLGRVEIAWDSPVLHVKVNDPDGWQRGIPDAYAAIDWARAYKEFLEDWGRLMRSLSRYAWRATVKGNAAAKAKAAITTTPSRSPISGEPNHAGATALVSPDAALEAINKSGATIDSESGRPLAMMVASALDVPVTMLLGDPGQTGARAVAQTLDQPTELAMQQRRELWADVIRRQLRYVITEAVRAPQGGLTGTIKRDTYGRETVALAGDTDTTIDVAWPDLDDVEPQVLVEAITKAAATGTIPPELVARLLLQALGVRDVDGIVEALTDEQGNFMWPSPPPIAGGGTGQVAADATRTGADPADVGGSGRMTPDGADGGDGEGAAGDDPTANPDPAAPPARRGRRGG